MPTTINQQIDEIITILDNEEYMVESEYVMTPGVKEAIAKLRELKAELAKKES